MGFGDVGHDGQAEAEPVRAGGPVRGTALEGLKQTADLFWRYERSGVGYGKRRFGETGGELDLDASASDVVTDGVVEQIRRQLV